MAAAFITKVVVEAVVSSLLALISLIGNILVVLVVYKNSSLQTNVNLLLVNLAFADMVAAVFVLPRFLFKLIANLPEGKDGDVLCKFIRDISWIGGQASAFTLVGIAVERHFAILHPEQRRGRISKGKFRLIVIGSWIYGITLELPSIYSSKYNSQLGICDEHWDNETLAQIYSIVLFVLNFVIPMAALSFAYFGIVKHFWGKETSISTNITNMALFRYRKRITIVLLAVAISYGVCWLPLPLFYMLFHNTGENPVIEYNSATYNFAVILISLNSCLDPIFYSLQSERFARALRRLLCCKDEAAPQVGIELVRQSDNTSRFKRGSGP